jgi:hypothetical protein
MRHISLRVVPSGAPNLPPFAYRDALRQILYAPPAGGHLLSEAILQRHEVAKVIAAAPADAAFVVLEEEQYRVLRAAEKSFPWGMAGPVIAEFILEIQGAPKIDPNHATEDKE